MLLWKPEILYHMPPTIITKQVLYNITASQNPLLYDSIINKRIRKLTSFKQIKVNHTLQFKENENQTYKAILKNSYFLLQKRKVSAIS